MNVESLLEGYLKEKVSIKYFPNRGNAGDSLINVGFYGLADRMGLKYEVIGYDCEDLDGEVLIVAGGGALVKEQCKENGLINFLMKAVKRTKRIVILPQSINSVDEFLSILRPQDIVFCRELYSYQYCISLGLVCSVFMDDDMAFRVVVNDVLNYSGGGADGGLKNFARHVIFFSHFFSSKIRSYIFAFRCDKERNLDLKVRRRIWNDFSAVARFSSGGVRESYYSAAKLLKLVNLYDEIHTDRLHVVIAASLLKKKVYAYEGSYYKVRGVVDKSLSKESNVVFRCEQ